jgi:hypothetical protein
MAFLSSSASRQISIDFLPRNSNLRVDLENGANPEVVARPAKDPEGRLTGIHLRRSYSSTENYIPQIAVENVYYDRITSQGYQSEEHRIMYDYNHIAPVPKAENQGLQASVQSPSIAGMAESEFLAHSLSTETNAPTTFPEYPEYRAVAHEKLSEMLSENSPIRSERHIVVATFMRAISQDPHNQLQKIQSDTLLKPFYKGDPIRSTWAYEKEAYRIACLDKFNGLKSLRKLSDKIRSSPEEALSVFSKEYNKKSLEDELDGVRSLHSLGTVGTGMNVTVTLITLGIAAPATIKSQAMIQRSLADKLEKKRPTFDPPLEEYAD